MKSHHLRRTAAAALAVVATLVISPGAAPAAVAPSDTHTRHSVAAPTAAAAKPTIVFVHGAFADASGWTQEVVRLQRKGYDVIAPANPLRGLTYDADYIRSVLATLPGPVVLVGHSYGGAVITNAARGADNVAALVYVGAFVPDAGQTILTSYDPVAYPGSLLGPDTVTVRPTYNPAAPGGQDADVYIRTESFRSVFAGDRPPRSRPRWLPPSDRSATSLSSTRRASRRGRRSRAGTSSRSRTAPSLPAASSSWRSAPVPKCRRFALPTT